MRLANLMDAGRVTDPENPSLFVAAGNGTDPRAIQAYFAALPGPDGGFFCVSGLREVYRCGFAGTWNSVLRQDGDDMCDLDAIAPVT